MNRTDEKLTAKDFVSDQEIRWCPGCGDFQVLRQVQNVMPQLGVPKENIVFVSGIGCSSRFPYYMNTYGMHSIHGRAAAIATGLKISNPDLSVWVVTGDGDSLSIGGNHLIHLLRRNIDLNVLLFNNEIYGLTKGQFSPTSEKNKVTKSSPNGTLDKPFNPISLALGAGATFVGRSIDRNGRHLKEMLLESHSHQGTSFLEIYQNCHIFNDKAFENFSDRDKMKDFSIYLEHGKPILFGMKNEYGLKLDGTNIKIVNLSEGYSVSDLMVHNQNDRNKAYILSTFEVDKKSPHFFGTIFRDYQQLVYPQKMHIISDLRIKKILGGQLNWTI